VGVWQLAKVNPPQTYCQSLQFHISKRNASERVGQLFVLTSSVNYIYALTN